MIGLGVYEFADCSLWPTGVLANTPASVDTWRLFSCFKEGPEPFASAADVNDRYPMRVKVREDSGRILFDLTR